MWLKNALVSILVLCGTNTVSLAARGPAGSSRSNAGGAQMRVGVVTGYHALFERACQRVCGTAPRDCVAECLHDNLPPEVKSLQAIEQDADDDAMRCLAAGGLLVERMPACSDGIEALIRLDGRGDGMDEMLAAISAFSAHCSADVLCEGLDAPVLYAD